MSSFRFIVPSLTVTISLLSGTSLSSASFLRDNYGLCANVAACGANSSWTGVQRLDCLGEILFRQPDLSAPNPGNTLIFHEYGPGWGNAILRLQDTCSIAATLGRSVLPRYNSFERMFQPPDGSGVWSPIHDSRPWAREDNLPGSTELEKFEFWFREASQEKRTFDSSYVLVSADQQWANNPCIKAALPDFFRCIERHDVLHLVPVYHGIFVRPSQLMANTIAAIRERHGLPVVGLDEPYPGSWGLRAPGFYVLAFHFRAMPLGFEPLASKNPSRFADLDDFWAAATSVSEWHFPHRTASHRIV